MMNTGAKLKILKPCLLQASTEDTNLQSTHSGSFIGSNDDLLTEILLRLPVKSITRFKSVSKHWRWLLSHRSFTLRYDKLLKSPGIFFHNIYVPYDVEENRRIPPIRSFDFFNDPHGIKIVQSCNGLLLCSSNKGDKSVRRYYVFNPTTKNFQIIPLVIGGESARKTIRFMGLAFHQTNCVHYKVVCVRRLRHGRNLFQIQIYSSDTGNWKISMGSFLADYRTFHTRGVYWNGAFHWASYIGDSMFFDIILERLETLPSLEKTTVSSKLRRIQYFGESRGHLHLIVTKWGRADDISFGNVYEMLSDRSGWFLMYQLDFNEIRLGTNQRYPISIMDLVRGVKEDDTFLVLHTPGKLIKYNVHDKSFKMIFNRELYKEYSYLHGKSFEQIYKSFYTAGYYHRYTETLASF